MPALFHGFELSCATPLSRSYTRIFQLGSSRWMSAPRVALMIPPPMRTTSIGSTCFTATR